MSCWKDWCNVELKYPGAREERTCCRSVPVHYPERSTFHSPEGKVDIDRATFRSRIQEGTARRKSDWIPGRSRRRKHSHRRCCCSWNRNRCMVSTRNHPSGSDRVGRRPRSVPLPASTVADIRCTPARSCTACTEPGTARTLARFHLNQQFENHHIALVGWLSSSVDPIKPKREKGRRGKEEIS